MNSKFTTRSIVVSLLLVTLLLTWFTSQSAQAQTESLALETNTELTVTSPNLLEQLLTALRQLVFLLLGQREADTSDAEPPYVEPEPIPSTGQEPPASPEVVAGPEFRSISIDGRSVEVSAVTSIVISSGSASVCGPIAFGEIDWGDGATDTLWGLGCGSARQTIAATHEYDREASYTLTLTDLQAVTVSRDIETGTLETIEVPPAPYTLTDVSYVSSEYFDPEPLMADEEYTQYIIVLKDGREFEVRVGFTPLEYRNEQFRKTGYVGDIDELMQLADTRE